MKTPRSPSGRRELSDYDVIEIQENETLGEFLAKVKYMFYWRFFWEARPGGGDNLI